MHIDSIKPWFIINTSMKTLLYTKRQMFSGSVPRVPRYLAAGPSGTGEAKPPLYTVGRKDPAEGPGGCRHFAQGLFLFCSAKESSADAAMCLIGFAEREGRETVICVELAPLRAVKYSTRRPHCGSCCPNKKGTTIPVLL